MLPILQLGPFSLRTPGLALLIGLWLALDVAERIGVRRGIDGNRTYNLGLTALVAGIIGARLSFVLMNLSLYTQIRPITRALLSVGALAPGTEYPLIGVVIAGIAAALLIRRWHLPIGAVLDTFAPALAIMMVAISAANLLSGEAYGVETNTVWGIPLWGARRHPTQILMMIAGLASLAVLWRTGIAQTGSRSGGFYMQITLLMLSTAILLIEPLRADSPVILGSIRVWQVIALSGIISTLAMMTWQAPIHAAERAL
jgi:phosphatidylglycerol---prolipoprotein diacylglyceryl transferase